MHLTGTGATKAQLAFLTQQPFAHRGLHDAAAGIPENSLTAFDRAIAEGHGIELDVQLTADGDVVVFHDATLERLTDMQGQVSQLSCARLEALRLKGSDETIHSLASVLMHVGGRVPILIEVKTPTRRHLAQCIAVRRALEGYLGPVAVMSFNPNVPGWFATHAPHVIRGLVMTDEHHRSSRFGIRQKLERFASIWRARPQFLAYDIRSLPSSLTTTARAHGLPVLTWTVRSAPDRARAAQYADQIIYEIEARPRSGA